MPGNRNGLTATQAYPGLGSILNTESTLINQSQRNNLQQQQQSQLNVNLFLTSTNGPFYAVIQNFKYSQRR